MSRAVLGWETLLSGALWPPQKTSLLVGYYLQIIVSMKKIKLRRNRTPMTPSRAGVNASSKAT
jgi:hypothetical protein